MTALKFSMWLKRSRWIGRDKGLPATRCKQSGFHQEFDNVSQARRTETVPEVPGGLDWGEGFAKPDANCWRVVYEPLARTSAIDRSRPSEIR
jgi:hypothetical protein